MYIGYDFIRVGKHPERKHPMDAGFDFFVPDDFEEVVLKPGDSVQIPSGVIVEIPPGFMGQLLNKGGVASKHSLVLGACVVDPYYSNEVFIDMHNIGNKDVTIKSGMKIAQMVIIPVVHAALTMIDKETIYRDFKSDEYRDKKGGIVDTVEESLTIDVKKKDE